MEEDRRRAWTKDRVSALIFQIILLLFIIGGIVLYRWNKIHNEYYKTGVMDGGELCVAYRCAESAAGESYILEGNAVTESSRFAFSEFSGRIKTGRIYTPVSEGEAKLYTSHSEKQGEVIYERFDITVDGSLNITFTQNTLTEEEYSEAAGLPTKKEDTADEKDP